MYKYFDILFYFVCYFWFGMLTICSWIYSGKLIEWIKDNPHFCMSIYLNSRAFSISLFFLKSNYENPWRIHTWCTSSKWISNKNDNFCGRPQQIPYWDKYNTMWWASLKIHTSIFLCFVNGLNCIHFSFYSVSHILHGCKQQAHYCNDGHFPHIKDNYYTFVFIMMEKTYIASRLI